MGILTPLYLAGLAALSLPLVLHLIRRTPRGRQMFSSLMFLSPSPPRLTRRSRLDHLLLLTLRLTALALLAFAFARPFLREAAVLPLAELPGRRVAILLDTSASMRREGLWEQAAAKIEETLADLGPADDVSLITFDDRRRTVIDFSDDGESRAGKADLVRGQLRELKPSWRATRLGEALAAVAAELDTQADVRQSSAEPQLIVVSDFARGCQTEALQAFRWPERVPAVLHALASRAASNAGVRLLVDLEAPTAEPRVRVTNAADSAAEQFFVHWRRSERQNEDSAAPAIYVPAGQSRVVRLPRPETAAAADRIALRGDDADFDNTFYVVPPRPRELTVAWLGGNEAVTAESPRYFFELAVADDTQRKINLRQAKTAADLRLNGAEAPAIVMVESALDQPLADALKVYAEAGGMVVMLATDELAASVAHLLDDVQAGEPTVAAQDGKRSYQMLSDIDFAHPLFAALANPRYSDFTKIHFWRYQPLRPKPGASTRVLAGFDNGDAAILERLIGRGRLVAFTSGWQPDESQLALSSKFVPLIQSLLDLAAGGEEQSPALTVGEPLSLPRASRKNAVVEKPDGSRVSIPADAITFADTDMPGIYRLYLDGEERSFAVNLAAAESDTAPLELDTLEQLGVRMFSPLTRAQRAEQARQQRDTELESRQHLWRWLIVAAIGLLILETCLAGRPA